MSPSLVLNANGVFMYVYVFVCRTVIHSNKNSHTVKNFKCTCIYLEFHSNVNQEVSSPVDVEPLCSRTKAL